MSDEAREEAQRRWHSARYDHDPRSMFMQGAEWQAANAEPVQIDRDLAVEATLEKQCKMPGLGWGPCQTIGCKNPKRTRTITDWEEVN